MLTKFENFDSGSNYKFGDKMEKPSVKRSLFDLSHTVALSYPKEGAIIPITWWETIIGDDFDIDVDALLRFQPLLVPPYSRSRLFIYAFWSPYPSLWSNFQVFMDKGLSGNETKKVPCYKFGTSYNVNPYPNSIYRTSFDSLAPVGSLNNYLGIPLGVTVLDNKTTGNLATFGGDGSISILPNMMCLRVYRDYFLNRDEWINDRVLFPHDDSRFRVGDDGRLLSAVDEGWTTHLFFWYYHTQYSSGNIDSATPGYKSLDISTSGSGSGLTTTYVFNGMWHEWAQDYFTSAKPFTQRGNSVGIPVNIPSLSIQMKKESFFGSDVSGSNGVLITDDNGAVQSAFQLGYSPSTGTMRYPFNVPSSANFTNLENAFGRAMEKDASTVPLTSGAFQIPISDLRGAIINQLELERMAHTDGSYAQFGMTFFGEKPRSAVDYRPVYIGGTYKPILFSQVLQTSASQSSAPLGSYAGHGIAGMKNGRIGHIHCDDYGIIMLYAVILPDTYYSEGLPKKFTRTLQEEFFLSGREKLGMQPILNREIYANSSGTLSSSNIWKFNGLFAYQDSWDEYRYIENSVRGKLADPTNNSYYPYTQSRHFTSVPNWGHEFSSTFGNVRNSFLTSTTEDVCTIQFAVNVRAVRPLPYRPTVGQIIN